MCFLMDLSGMIDEVQLFLFIFSQTKIGNYMFDNG